MLRSVCLLACLFQIALGQCSGSLGQIAPVNAVASGPGYGYGELGLVPAYDLGGYRGLSFPGPYNSNGNYGGVGTADVSVVGEMPVAGSTVVVGQVPVVGNVRFGGQIPAGGIFSVSGSCSCGLNGAIIS
ncbi:unnamed protein product [Parnassius apollo]|uniref:(apollo) hypothetical protein n=1 Tax=Parnassius apollo TaxID=110799 RepID=A0A8S3WG49_PARAO|nr:unnamed protein product [Parnassius apollo]